MNLSALKTLERPLVILLLEDEPLIAMDLQFVFEDHGAEVHVAASCGAASEIIDKFDIDGAVLDVNLGRGETCEHVATRLRALNVPFILHTGDLDRQGEAIRKLEATVVPKPTPAPAVAQRILEELARPPGG